MIGTDLFWEVLRPHHAQTGKLAGSEMADRDRRLFGHVTRPENSLHVRYTDRGLTESGTIDPGMPCLRSRFTVAQFAAFLRRAEES